jgi:hypothetical protein
MEINCPSCNKANQSSLCQRCGGDLEPLFAIRGAAKSYLALAAEALKEGKGGGALAYAEQSWSLYHSPEAAQLAFLSCVQGQDAAAGEWLRRARTADAAGIE